MQSITYKKMIMAVVVWQIAGPGRHWFLVLGNAMRDIMGRLRV